MSCKRYKRTNRHRGKASTINFEIFEKCEFDLTSPFLERISFNIGCVQQRKSLSERSLILYYDWFLHLDPVEI